MSRLPHIAPRALNVAYGPACSEGSVSASVRQCDRPQAQPSGVPARSAEGRRGVVWCKGRALIGRGDGEGERSSVVRQRQRLRQRTGIPVATIDDRPDSELERTPSRSTRLNPGHVPNGACHTSHAACFAQVGPPHVMRCVTGGIGESGACTLSAQRGAYRGAPRWVGNRTAAHARACKLRCV